MGSEGRGEYLSKTDQDNGIILADGYQPPDWDGFRQRFTAAMIEAGFPACPGEIMVRNPAWSKPLQAWCDDVRGWVLKPDEQALMNVAIFYDAAAVAGDGRLLDQAKLRLFDLLAEESAFHARFARAIELFDTPLGFFSTFVTERRRAQGRARPQEGRHLSADARRARAGAGAAAGRDQHGRAHPPAAGSGRVRQGRRRSSSPTPSTSCWACGSRRGWRRCACTSRSTISSASIRSPSSSATCSRTRCRSSSASRRWCAITSTSAMF